MPACAELTKLRKKETFDTNLDPDPDWLLICHMCSNEKNEAIGMLFVTRYHMFYLDNN